MQQRGRAVRVTVVLECAQQPYRSSERMASEGGTHEDKGHRSAALPLSALAHRFLLQRESVEQQHHANRTRRHRQPPSQPNSHSSTPFLRTHNLGTRADVVVRHQAQLGTGESHSNTLTHTFYAVQHGHRRIRRMLTIRPPRARR